MRAHNYQHTFVNYLALYRIDCIYRNNFHISRDQIHSIHNCARVYVSLWPPFVPMFCEFFVWRFGLNGTADGPSRSSTHIETSHIKSMPRVIFDVMCNVPLLKQTFLL